MKQLFFLILLCSILSTDIIAQDNRAGEVPVAVPLEKGVWVYFGQQLPKNMQYQVERKKGTSGRFEKIGNTTAPASESEIKSRQLSYGKYFEKLDPLSEKEINRIWQTIQKYNTADSLFSDNLPVMHLVAGTAYFDATAAKNENYIYKISLAGSDGKIISSRESNPTTSFKKGTLPSISFVEKKYADGKLAFTWSVADPMKMAHFNVYRSVFGKEEFKKINIEKGTYTQGSKLMLLGIDTIGTHPAWYEYEIAAVDAYGNEGPLQGSASGGNVQDYYAPPVTHFKAINTGRNHEVKLSWRFENKKYLNGITVMRSALYDSGYKRIATVPLGDTVFTDIIPVSGENYYYYLLLLSADNKPVPTAKVFAAYTGDQSLPEPPNEIDATPVNKGINVYWKSEEPYSKGFYVYRRDQPNGSFTLVSPLINSGQAVYSFIDTSGQLQPGGVYQYVVRTINDNNQLSKPSDTVTANPGITKTITSPVNLRYRESDGKITLLWDDMRPWESDLLGYKVYRKSGNGNFIRMANDSLLAEHNFFEDSTIQAGANYSYAVTLYDISGNESEKSVIAVSANAETLPGAPSGIRVSQPGNEVYITWGQIAGDVNAIKIYRSEPGIAAKLIGTVTEDDFFTDKNVTKGKLYFYQLSSVNNGNKEGALSEKVSLRMK
ncbi:MAG: hypothetical protein IT250_10440 [Chitinophagaceae bacterium]|nr:hypothetical protein [Chitinophagaceae bacterium]